MHRSTAAVVAFLVAIAVIAEATACRRDDAASVAPPTSSESSPQGAAPRVGPSLVLITLDTVRADHLGCYGYFRDTTPRLDAFATECVRFTRCLAPIAHTAPSHVSLFTGVYPLEHGLVSNSSVARLLARKVGETPLPTLRTLGQAMAASGRRTGGFVSATPVKRASGLSAGFEVWSEPTKASMRRVGNETVDHALDFLKSVGDAPFFVWVHLFDAHGPVESPSWPPQRYLELFKSDDALDHWLHERGFPETVNGRPGWKTTLADANTYDALLRFLDDDLAPLLDFLDAPARRADTAVVVTADHGEGLWQHGFRPHGIAWDEQFYVPLMIRAPGRAPGVVDATVSTIDVLPTLAGLAPSLRDEALLAQCAGHDVLAEEFEPRPVFGMAEGTASPTTTLTTSRWKLMRAHDGSFTLYDLSRDPHELHDVAAQHADVVAQLGRVLDAEVEGQKRRRIQRDGADLPGAGGAADPELARQLQALGYADGDEDAPPPEPNPTKSKTKEQR